MADTHLQADVEELSKTTEKGPEEMTSRGERLRLQKTINC